MKMKKNKLDSLFTQINLNRDRWTSVIRILWGVCLTCFLLRNEASLILCNEI